MLDFLFVGLVLHAPIMSGLRVLTDSRLLCCFDIFPNIDRIKGINVPLFVIHGEVCIYESACLVLCLSVWHRFVQNMDGTACLLIQRSISFSFSFLFSWQKDLEVKFKHGTSLLEAGTYVFIDILSPQLSIYIYHAFELGMFRGV